MKKRKPLPHPNRSSAQQAAGRPAEPLSQAEQDQLVALFNGGRYAELESRARALLDGPHPKSGFAWKVLGIALTSQGKAGLSALQKAAELRADDADAHFNLGLALANLGRPDEAVESYRRALAIRPDSAEVHNDLGNALANLGRLEDAVASFRKALAIKPDLAVTHNNLGLALTYLGRLGEAVPCYCRALAIKPDFAYAHNNLGLALADLGRLDEAVASCRRALEINPNYAEAYSTMGKALSNLGRVDLAVASFRRALNIRPAYAEAHSDLLLAHNYLPGQPPELLLSEAQRFGDLVAQQARPYTDWQNLAAADRCLRVGLVSGDLRAHPVGYFIEGLLAALAATTAGRLEILAYPTHSRQDALAERIQACCRSWHPVAGLSDERLAALIRDDGVDILIDLAGHTAYNRLPVFAWKPAPVQVSWLGYFATTGVAAIDYLIADPWTLPESEEAHFTEKIWRLPETRFCFTSPDVEVPVSALPALANGHVTFGCFNNLTKMNDAVVALWARVLQAVPGSRLFLKATQLASPSVRQNVADRFAAQGIDGSRLILEGPSPRAQYLATYGQIDIALDPFPFTGGTTTAESLWMGVPVLTLAGNRLVSRQGLGLMVNAGLPDWVAADADDYIARAALHAGDLHRLAALRDSLRRQVLASPIFDAPRFARHFEAALRGMWTHWCNRQTGRIAAAPGLSAT